MLRIARRLRPFRFPPPGGGNHSQQLLFLFRRNRRLIGTGPSAVEAADLTRPNCIRTKQMAYRVKKTIAMLKTVISNESATVTV
jgi:hypothetical protein